MLFISYLLLGAVAGLLSGLLGIGGGLVVVPCLALAFATQGFDANVATHIAISTSLSSMLFTTSSSAFAHHKKQGIVWKVFLWVSVGLLAGGWLGGLLTASMNGRVLKLMLAIFVLLMSLRMWRKKNTQLSSIAIKNKFIYVFSGFVIGCISVIFGIGGGFMTVPVLVRFGLVLKNAVGTASACSIPIALIGTITSIFMGYGVPELPAHTIGYIYWPAFIGIIIGSIPCASIGARLAHKLPAQRLRKIFAIFLLVVGCELLFDDKSYILMNL